MSGWYVVNAREAEWGHSDDLGSSCRFQDFAHFEEFGFNVTVLQPGQPNARYHAGNRQEGFLVLEGECTLVVDGGERTLRRWDYFHCPPGTPHVFVGAGESRCVIVMVGARRAGGENVYACEPAAARHGAAAARETRSAEEAYEGVAEREPGPYRAELLD